VKYLVKDRLDFQQSKIGLVLQLLEVDDDGFLHPLGSSGGAKVVGLGWDTYPLKIGSEILSFVIF
jgi:hypothetical protein